MSLLKSIKQQAKTILQSNADESGVDMQNLSNELLKITATAQLEATSIFPHLNEVQSKQPELVYVSLVVQDILETQYYYAYLVSKPLNKNSQIYILKYGNSETQLQNINMQEYQPIMDSRETLVCLPDFYGSKWVYQEWKGSTILQQSVNIKVSGKNQFKLGEKVNAVCLWDPYEKCLIFDRLATKQQIIKQKLSFEQACIGQSVSYKQTRQTMLSNLNKFCAPIQSMMILFSMISQQPLFINGQNIKSVLQHILPRVSQIKIKAPFKQSLFPYKNSEGQLIQSPMQMSIQRTYVIIDFSQFSNQKQVKIDQAQIDNLKALKMFVQQGKTVYRWQYGQSLNDHHHSGIIVKGSKILTPNFHLSQNLISKKDQNMNPFLTMQKQAKQKLRIYIQKCLMLRPVLSQQSRKKIETQLKELIAKNPDTKLMIEETMQIAKLNAKSQGREIIQYEDYIFARKILSESQ